MYLLSGEKITCGYGLVDIVSSCTIGVKKGEISSVVGPNGAGKSTAMKALFGLLPIKNGKVFFNGEDITSLPQEVGGRTRNYLLCFPSYFFSR